MANTNIHPIRKLGAQGDVVFRRVKGIPSHCKKREQKGPLVVAHSETGHNHEIATKGVEMWEDPNDPMVCYLKMDIGVDATVEHHRSFDTHEPLKLLGDSTDSTVFQVIRQREYTPEGWRRVED